MTRLEDRIRTIGAYVVVGAFFAGCIVGLIFLCGGFAKHTVPVDGSQDEGQTHGRLIVVAVVIVLGLFGICCAFSDSVWMAMKRTAGILLILLGLAVGYTALTGDSVSSGAHYLSSRFSRQHDYAAASYYQDMAKGDEKRESDQMAAGVVISIVILVLGWKLAFFKRPR